MAGSAALKGAAPVFAALGDETRLRLVSRLCAGGPASIARLTAASSVTRQAITKHLQVLAGAGLVRSTRRGRERVWELRPRQFLQARERQAEQQEQRQPNPHDHLVSKGAQHGSTSSGAENRDRAEVIQLCRASGIYGVS